ncbi:MAG: hypothetical protein J6Y19_06165, partial [Kiritimatiellae bacterium]|nr:hypothetical protein [Kiritimatiellia bacterium]
DEATDEANVGTYLDTESQVSISFPAEEATGTARKTFRLYGYRATKDVANEEALAAGTPGAVPEGSTGANWGIQDLTLLGIVSGPKKKEVTDQDVKAGTWGNQVEVMDGLETGYDTHRSGLWLANNGEEYAQKLPEFTVTYPTHSGMDPSLAGTEVWSDTFNVEQHADASIDYTADADFTDDPTTAWTLTGGATVTVGTTESGRVLKLPGSDSQAGKAVQTKALTDMSGKVAVSAQATARVRSTVAASSTEVEAVNGFKLTLEFLSSSDGVMETATETFTATRAWKDFTVGPVTLENNLVRKIRVTIEEETDAGTGLEADRVEGMASAFSTMTSGAPDNGVPSARLKLDAPALATAATKNLPLSQTTAAAWKYGLLAKIYDYDHDRDNDALPTSREASFFLYDDDESAPQPGRKYGGAFGVTMNGTVLPSKHRVTGSLTESRTNMVWSLSDHALAESAGAGADIGFMLDYYDFSGWRVTKLEFQPLNPASGAAQGTAHTVLSGGTET